MDGILTTSSAIATAEAWLGDFGAALASGEASRIAALFAEECHWRDILAFTWDLRTASGAEAIAQRMAPDLAHMAPRGFALAAGRTPPRRVVRAGVDTIEAIFGFETSVGPCNGVVRLVFEAGAPRAWTPDDRAGRNPRSRRPGQRPALAGRGLEAQFRRRELARPAQAGAGLRGS